MNKDQAETIALSVLAYVMGRDELRQRFIEQTGLNIPNTGSGVIDSEILSGGLDFLLDDESLLLEFCDDASIAPELPIQARAALPNAMPLM